MMNFKDFPQLKKVMQKQCEFAGLKFEDVDFTQPEWFSKYTWTVEDEEDFRAWFLSELKSNKKMRDELFSKVVTNMKLLKKAVNMFILTYGFKLKEKDEEEK